MKEKSNGAVKCFLMDPCSCGIKYSIATDGKKLCLAEKDAQDKEADKGKPSTVIEGVGSSKLYLPLSRAVLDAVLTASDQLAFEMAAWCVREEGYA